jgi:hypothetical protein
MVMNAENTMAMPAGGAPTGSLRQGWFVPPIVIPILVSVMIVAHGLYRSYG